VWVFVVGGLGGGGSMTATLQLGRSASVSFELGSVMDLAKKGAEGGGVALTFSHIPWCSVKVTGCVCVPRQLSLQ